MYVRRPSGVPTWVLAALSGLALVAALAALALVGGRSLPERAGPPVEALAVERVALTPGSIELGVRNTGPDPVQVAQVFVNDAYVDVSGAEEPIGRLGSDTLQLDYPWQDGQPYLVSLLTSTGAVVEHEIPVAVATPPVNTGFFGLMALLGAYVGIVPVLLGIAFLPVLQRLGSGVIRGLLAVTVGLLAFLAVDGALEGIELAETSGAAFGGVSLVALGAALAFLLLTAVDRWLGARRAATGSAGDIERGRRLALMIAVGIGLHNLGEGLAIGSAYAIGELALGASLIVGFALHNTTEGVAVVAPMAGQRPSVLRLVSLGLVAGAPAILGTVIGAAANNAELSALLLGVGVGAIVQVVVQLLPALRARAGAALDTVAVGGLAGGMLVMYLTGLLVIA